ncbi:epoxyqueuosine reductase [Candidatus Poriferisodalis sp.]|uniref:epoxyqueuosine reductase n=1 Tax=Candidatus Poriferisodalis sp. TaxID=3101277 RepID=UPI003B024D91
MAVRPSPVSDDNRLVDRAAAARAGLGWLGRNTMLLSDELGSWTVLGAVVTTAVLPVAGALQPDGCGSCRRCSVACPTGALDVAGVLDANRCFAWMLQATGSFPAEFRVALGDRLYGCDDCQVVCPYNEDLGNETLGNETLGPTADTSRQPVQLRDRAAVSRAPRVDVIGLLEMSDEQLMATFGHWYIPRRRPEYLRRNALVVPRKRGRPRRARCGTRAAAGTGVDLGSGSGACRVGGSSSRPRRSGGGRGA